MSIFLYILIGLAVGSVSGAFGIGGGVLLVPMLIWLCEFEPRKATGTSLAVLALPVCLPAAFTAFRKNHVDLEAVLWIAGAFLVGALTTRAMVDYLPDRALRFLFGLLMVYIAARFLLSANSEAAYAGAGLVAVGLAWLAFLGLRLLGRRHLAAPVLGQEIQRMQHEHRGDPDYYI